MKDKTEVSLSVVVLNCLCAIIWDINLIVNLVSGYSDTYSLIMHTICAIAWSICGIIWTIRYIKSKKEKER